VVLKGREKLISKDLPNVRMYIGRMRNEYVASSHEPSQNLHEWTEEGHKKSCQNSRPSDRQSNTGHPEYDAGMPNFLPPYSVTEE
jgi:hypothetical protein